ncbi:gibberellin-regulated protein 14-like isoform X2 [Anopheles stephensi]|uniref:gibberellin-regulated protein 14-like isoform X2 n=1 Tax=Anopheles stephensi TaxID=30069 RepID=UPI001658972C|nr:gibberellin-regulated protein 14-like isoform X2 [Anopheles stephensi]
MRKPHAKGFLFIVARMLSLVSLLLIASASGLSQTKTVPLDFCSEYEVLHTTPPCCEATCDYDCCRVVCPKMLVYEPTCVCLEGYVRHDGQCIPKSHCPAQPATTTPAPCQTTTTAATPPPPCTTTTPAPCTASKPPPCTTTKPPCPATTTKPPCSTTNLPYVLTTPRTYGYTPPPRVKYSPVTYVPPPPSPAYQTLPPYRYPPVLSSSRATPKVTAYQTVPTLRPCASTMKPPPCTTTKPPCPTTPAPTTTPCPPPTGTTPPPTKAPCSKPPAASCAACEELVFVQPCCEPTCDFDCSNAGACPLVLVEQPTCACRPGLVRYQGHCIEPAACPKSASRYRLYVPVAAQCLKCGNK